MIIKRYIYLLCLLTLSLLVGCGPREAEGGAIGTAMGTVAGLAISGDDSKAEGALVGALVGHTVGRLIGHAEDQQDKVIIRDREIVALERENRNLRKQLEKWCPECKIRITLEGANVCPRCGNMLITQKFCRICKENFEPNSGYRYCPYCPQQVLLSYR